MGTRVYGDFSCDIRSRVTSIVTTDGDGKTLRLKPNSPMP